MLEMVHYILRFIIIMTHTIYAAILYAAEGFGGELKAPPVRSGAEPQRKSNLMHFSLKM